MKKMVTVTTIFLLAVSFLLAGNSRAEAMNNESAAVLAGAIAIFGLTAIAQEAAYSAHYRPAYPSTRYVERTKIIYAGPRHRIHRERARGYGRGHQDGWCRHHEFHHGRDDARRDYRRHRGYN